jgi:hypothetical protein
MTDQVVVNDPNPDNVEDANTLLLEPKGDPKPAAPEPAKPEPVVADDAVVAFEPTGDVGLDMALEFLGKQGFGLQHPAMVAAGNGDFTVLEALLAQKNAQGWQQMVALGKAGYERTQNAQKEAVSKTLATVEAVAGGKEEWAAIQSWARDNATAEERTEINTMLNAGGLQAKTAALYLKDAYGRATNVNITPPDGTAFKGEAKPQQNAVGPLSARDYTAAVADLSRKLGNRMEGSKEYAELGRRRLMGMK